MAFYYNHWFILLYFTHSLSHLNVNTGINPFTPFGASRQRSTVRHLSLSCSPCSVPHLDQVRLSSYSNLAIETYLLPNTLMKNFTSVALVMSGYDFPSIRTMQFRAQISYDDVGNVFEILVTTFSGSTYNFINYFIITVSQNGNNYFAVTSACTSQLF